MANTEQPAEKATPLWKISNYRPFGIIERDPSESTYEYGDDKFPIIVNVCGTLVEQKERAELIVRSVNQSPAFATLVEAANDCVKRMELLREMLKVSGARDAQWQILDTVEIRAALALVEKGEG